MDWHLILDLGGFGVILLTLAAGYGRFEQKVKDMGKKVEELSRTVREHDGQLSDGAGNFKVIDTKLDYITKRVDEMARKLDKHSEDDG